LHGSLFWGVLFWKRRAEEALIASGIPYTVDMMLAPSLSTRLDSITSANGTGNKAWRKPTDAFKETHILVVAAEDTYVRGLVSNLQVAELIGFMAKNRKAAYCKVVEVIAETTAPLMPMDQLLFAIPSKRVRSVHSHQLKQKTLIQFNSNCARI
jgi:hypothetical protein